MAEKFTFSAGTTLPEIAESVAPELAFLARVNSPLLAAIGWPDEVAEAENVKDEWLEDGLLANESLINGTFTDSDSPITVDDGSVFRVGDVVQVEGSRELIVITAISTNDLTVTRAAFGTTGEAIADNSRLRRVGNPAIEDEDAPTARSTNRNRQQNYTQLFRDVAAVTRSMQLVKKLGSIDDELEHQIMSIEKDLMRDLAMAVIRGAVQTSNPEGTTAQARTMNGLIQAILGGSDPAIVDAQGQTLTETILNNGMQEAFTRGGSPTIIAASPSQKRAISAMIEGRTRYVAGAGIAGVVVERFSSDFGELDVLKPDNFIPNDVVLVVDPTRVALAKLGMQPEPFEHIELARTSLSRRVEVVEEYTLRPMNAGVGGHVLIHNLGT